MVSEKVKEEAKEVVKKYEVNTEVLDKGYFETKLSKIEAFLVGKKVKFKALLVGEAVGFALEKKACLVCENCGENFFEFDLSDEKNFLLTYARIKKQKLEPNTLNIDMPRLGCGKDRKRPHSFKFEFEQNDLVNLSILYVKELPEEIDAFSDEEYQSLASKTWKIYYLGIPKNVKRIQVEAYTVKNPSTNEIEFISYNIKPLEDEFLAIKITREDHQTFKRYFSDDNLFPTILEDQIAPHIVGRNFAKLSMLLTLHSPYKIPDIFNSRLIRGSLRTIWIGDTKTGKSEMGRDVTYMFYKIGELIFGETSSRAGLTYTIDTENRTIIWGALPTNDRKFVFIDGIHSITSEEIEQMREVLEQDVVKVSRSVSGERLARVRIIATLNPNHPPMKNYYYKVQALMDTNVFRNPVDITRWDIIIPFTNEDVEGNVIAEARPKERPIPYEIFRRHIFWVWALEPNQIRYSEDAKEKIIEFSKELFVYISSQCPLIHAGVRDHLTRLAVAFACLRHSVLFDENGNFLCVEVMKEHVEQAKEFLEEMIQNLDYDLFVLKNKEQTDLTKEEFEEILKEISDREISVLKQLVNGPKKSRELASILGIGERTVKEYYNNLRKFNLIITSQGFGVKLTTRGILFLKMLDNQLKTNKEETRDKENQENEKEGVYGGRSAEVQEVQEKNDTYVKNRTALLAPLHHSPHIPPFLKNKDISKDKTQTEQKTDNLTDKSKDIIYWQRLEKDVVDTIKNPPFARRIYRFELVSFLEQREYSAQEIERVLDKLVKQGVVIEYPDESLDLNFSKIQGDG
jgi:DNA-binding MarR family transcriptional regulator